MTSLTFEAHLEAAQAANANYRKNTTALRIAQQQLASERDALHLSAVEAATTQAEVRVAMKLCVKNSVAREEAFFKLCSLATTIEELQEIWSHGSRGQPNDRRYNDEVVTKWARLSMAEVEAAATRDEMWKAFNRCQLPIYIYWNTIDGVHEYVYSGLRPWEKAEAYLTQQYRDCTTPEEFHEVEKKYGSSGDIMRKAWREAHDRLYKERHGVAPTHRSHSQLG